MSSVKLRVQFASIIIAKTEFPMSLGLHITTTKMMQLNSQQHVAPAERQYQKDSYNIRICLLFINLCTSDTEKAVSKFIKHTLLYIDNDEIFDV